MTTFTVRRLFVAAAVAAAATSAVPSAFASGGGGGGGGVVNSGRCTTISLWSIEASPSGQGVHVRADVYTSLNSTWTWKLSDNGKEAAKGSAIANQERHDLPFFEVRKTVTDQQGSDTIHFVATQTITGEVCDGSVTV